MRLACRLLLMLALPLAIAACSGAEEDTEDPPPAGEHFPGVDQPSGGPSGAPSPAPST